MLLHRRSTAALLPMLIVGMAGVAHAQDMADTITVVSWGGAYQASQDNAYMRPYKALHPGFEAVWDENAADPVPRLRAMGDSGAVTWDLVDVTAAEAIRLCEEGLVMKIDHDQWLNPAPDGTPASEDLAALVPGFGDLLVSDCFIPQVIYSTAFAYRNDLVGDQPPTDVCAIFDTAAYPGKRSLEKRPINNMEWALLCDGVARDEIYAVLETEEGQARALAKLETIKDDVVWWSAGAETPRLLTDGQVVMGSGYNGRLFSLIEEKGQPVTMLWDAQVLDVDGWVVPMGLPEDRLARVRDFLRFATDTRRLADLSAFISYSPARLSSQPLIGKHAHLGIAMAPHLPTHPDNMETSLLFHEAWWSEHRDALDEKFQAWLSGRL